MVWLNRGLIVQPELEVGVPAADRVLVALSEEVVGLVVIGVDPHKRTHTLSVLGPGSTTVLASLQVEASLAGYRKMLRWAAAFPDRRWAVENARGLGRHLAQWLVARGEHVEDVHGVRVRPHVSFSVRPDV